MISSLICFADLNYPEENEVDSSKEKSGSQSEGLIPSLLVNSWVQYNWEEILFEDFRAFNC